MLNRPAAVIGTFVIAAASFIAPAANAQESPSVDLKVGQSVIAVHLPADEASAWRDRVVDHIKLAADAVAGYLGAYPVPRVSIIISAEDGHDVHGMEFDGDRITCDIGRQISSAELTDDWVVTHEMFHLAFPDMGDRYKWMNEGLSDYLEPIARAALKHITAEEVWQGFVDGMPKGQPEAGDQGLDRTHTWGRTYWGGCTYWLLADIRIREQSAGKKSLADAIRAIVAAGGTGDQTWPLEKVFQVGDAATGTHVLRDLHDELGPKPTPIDLDGLWRSLGVQSHGGKITFDDTAPKADIRKAILTKQ